MRDSFAGAEVGEVTVMVEDGVPNYEVVVAPAGAEAVEATVRLPEPAPPAPSAPPAEEPDAPPAPAPLRPPPPAPAAPRDAADAPAQAVLQSAPADDSAPPANAGERQSVAAQENPTPVDDDTPAEAAAGNDGVPAPGALASAQPASPPAAPAPADFDPWLPEPAGLTTRWLPPDPAVIELAIREVLDAARALTKQLAAAGGRTGTGSAAAPVALLAALIVAERVLLLYSRRNRGGPVVVFGAEHSTWGWVLGSPDPCHDPGHPGRPGG